MFICRLITVCLASPSVLCASTNITCCHHVFQIPSGTLELNQFKFYLARVLGHYQEQGVGERAQSGPLLLYRQDMRSLVGHVICPPDSSLGPSCPYVPLFYQNSPPIVAGKCAEVGNMRLIVCQHLCIT